MNKNPALSSTAKGDIFEKRAFNLIQELLNNDEYFLNRKNSKIFSKKGYKSLLRGSEIIFDITIESYMSGADQYSLLNVIECKYLNKNVSVDDIEEFESKLRQVGDHNTKGTLVSNIGFSKSTINIAKNLKIALLKIKNNNEHDWVNYRKDNKLNLNFENNDEPFLVLIGNKVLNNIADFLLESKIIDRYTQKDKFLKIKYIPQERLEEIANKLYSYDIHDDYCLNIEKLCAFLEERYPITFELQNTNDSFLGKIEFSPLKIFVNNTLDENRFRYTLCHEIGHLILHSNLMKDTIDKKEDNDYSLSLDYNISDRITRRIEIQANIFASYLLVPQSSLIEDIAKYFIKERIHKNYLYLDNQPTNQILVYNLLNQLSTKYKASVETIRIRLISHNILKDNTDFSFKKLLKNSG